MLIRDVASIILALLIYSCKSNQDEAKVILEYSEAEAGIAFNDPDLGIDWEYPTKDIILSEKDRALTSFKSIHND